MRVVTRALLALAVITAMCWGVTARAAFLEPEQAFPFSARVIDAKTIEVKYGIADGYYLYRERFKFALDPATSGGATLGEPALPKGEIKFDETFGKNVEHYRHEVAVRIPVQNATGPVTLLSTSQGCADAGLCYPPQQARATLILTAAAGGPSNSAAGTRADATASPALTSAASTAASTPTPGATSSALDDSSRIARTLKSGNLGWIALLFVGLGLLLAFTPCVLPMLPILSSIIVGQSTAHSNGETTRSMGFLLALAYSLGLALVYTLLGIAAGLAGEGLAAMLQTPLVLGTFALLLVVLSLSMFGFYELQVPASLQAKLAQWSGRVTTVGDGAREHGSQRVGVGRLAGVFAMGAISALIVGPCVAAPLAGALLYISQTRDVVIGGIALFSLSVGMSVPLLLIGLSAGSLLPRAGVWMETVKQFFGVLLLADALWMVTPIVPSWLVMLGWAVLAIVSAMYLRVFDALAPDARGVLRLGKGLGALLLLAGAVEFVGLATGGRDVLQPLAHLARTSVGNNEGTTAAAGPRFEIVKTSADLDRRIASAGRPVMLDFYADWCVSCKEMERYTYTDARVASRMQGFLLLKADVTANDGDDRELLKRFHLFGPPGIVFFDRDGKMVSDSTVIGFQDADRFLQSLVSVGDTQTLAPAIGPALGPQAAVR